MGTVDLLFGLVAAVTTRLGTGKEKPSVNIPVGDLCNILHHLQHDDRFADQLKYLDFDQIERDSYSEALESIFFQAGAWGLHRVPNPELPSISLDMSRAKKRLDRLRSEYGPELLGKLGELADEFVAILTSDEPVAGP